MNNVYFDPIYPLKLLQDYASPSKEDVFCIMPTDEYHFDSLSVPGSGDGVLPRNPSRPDNR